MQDYKCECGDWQCPDNFQRTGNSTAEGKKYDEGKIRWSLLPWHSLEQVAKALMFGATIYGDFNWEKVPDARRRYFEAGLRHVFAWWHGETKDPKSGLHPLAHAMCNFLFLLTLDTKEDRCE